MAYSLEERVFIVRTYWMTGSFRDTQQQFKRTFGVRHVPAKSTIHDLVRKLETTGSLLDERGKHRPPMAEAIIMDVRARLEQSPTKSLRQLSQETGYSYSTCQRAAKKAKLLPCGATSVPQPLEPDKEERLLDLGDPSDDRAIIEPSSTSMTSTEMPS